LKFIVNNQTITSESRIMLVAKTVGVYEAEFTFSEEWASYTKTAYFKLGENGTSYPKILTNNKCQIPPECINTGLLFVSVSGSNSPQEYPTQWCDPILIKCGARDDSSPGQPTPSVYTQIITLLTELALEKADIMQDATKAGKVWTIANDGSLIFTSGGGSGGTTDFEDLQNRPRYNSVTMTHDTNIPEVKTATWDGKYDKPQSGIPDSDLASTFLKEHQSLSAYRTSADQDVIDATKGTYSKPDSGIPSTDLTSSVQTSLGKADSALQTHQDISGKENTSNKVTSMTAQSTDTQYPSAKAVYDELSEVKGDIVDYSEVIADEYDATATYAVGDFCIHDKVLYKCSTAISTAETWTVAHWTPTQVVEEFGSGGGAMKIKIAGTAQTPDADGYVNIPFASTDTYESGRFVGHPGIVRIGNPADGVGSIFISEGGVISVNALHMTHLMNRYLNSSGALMGKNYDQAVKHAMCDAGRVTGDTLGAPLIWTAEEQQAALTRLGITVDSEGICRFGVQ